MKVIQFRDEAKKGCISVEVIRCAFENNIDVGKTLGVVLPLKMGKLRQYQLT